MYARIAENGASACFTDSEEESPEEVKEKVVDTEADDVTKKRRIKTKEDIEREAMENDLYGILELEDKTFEAGENDIRKAYQKKALKCHPDKLMEDYDETANIYWLKIQSAYETLMDLPKRRKYDSTLPFDEEIPKEGKFTDENFFEVFDVVFKRNARFGKKKPIPNIGTLTSSTKEVQAFYKYWDNFDSWREFTQYDEYDTTEAQDRYEKRYMENENRKLRAVYEKAERKRLIKLGEMAYNNDPRIKAIRKAEDDAKNQVKQQKKDFKSGQQAKIAQVK
jgi:DnaJ family protein C protein 2